MYLIDHRAENPRYVDQAKEILDWANRTMVVYPGLHPGIPGLIEQSQYVVVLTHHELRFAELYGKLWEATGDEKYKEMAEQIGNSVTWCLMSDGKMRQGFWYHAWGIPLILIFNDQFSRLMASVPETAPKGENHLLQATGFVEKVNYGQQEVSYRTSGESSDVLTVIGQPKAVKAGGNALGERSNPANGQDGWNYDSATQELRISHHAPDVTIIF